MFWTGEAPTLPGIKAKFSRPNQPCATVQHTNSCQSTPAPACTTQCLSVSLTKETPAISIFSTTACTSADSTMLLPPPSTKTPRPRPRWALIQSLVTSACKLCLESTTARSRARAAMPKVLNGCKETLLCTNMGGLYISKLSQGLSATVAQSCLTSTRENHNAII